MVLEVNLVTFLEHKITFKDIPTSSIIQFACVPIFTAKFYLYS